MHGFLKHHPFKYGCYIVFSGTDQVQQLSHKLIAYIMSRLRSTTSIHLMQHRNTLARLGFSQD